MPEPASYHVACDLGAESGRVILGRLEAGKLALEEIHRFTSGAVTINTTLRWDVLRIFEELKTGLKKIGDRKVTVASLSVDSWGVDYVLLHGTEPFLTAPYHYRDSRTESATKRVFQKVSPEEIFEETGIQFLVFNTLFQLDCDVEKNRKVMEITDGFLNIGDYFNYLFSGVRKAEESLASTTQLYNPKTRSWSAKLIRALGVPKQIFPEIVPSGTKLGPLLPEVSKSTDLSNVEVVATCSHDTGAAVAAVPAEGSGWAYLSSGTWSLLGVESPAAVITEKARKYNFTNEAGYGGTTRLLKNIVGLWVIQECRREWLCKGKEYTYEQLSALAGEAKPMRSFIHPAAARFGKPNDMPGKIVAYCQETHQPVPEKPGEFIRCVFESLALLYRQTMEEIETVTGNKIKRLHIVGGGCKSRLLNQFAANAIQREVLAGPVEATAIGNLLIQALAMGHLNSLHEMRRIVKNSFPLDTFSPCETASWENAYQKFKILPSNI